MRGFGFREFTVMPTLMEIRDMVEQEFARRFGIEQRMEREAERNQDEYEQEACQDKPEQAGNGSGWNRLLLC